MSKINEFFKASLTDNELDEFLVKYASTADSRAKTNHLRMFKIIKNENLSLEGESTASDRIYERIRFVFDGLSEDKLNQVKSDLVNIVGDETNCSSKCQAVIDFYLSSNPELTEPIVSSDIFADVPKLSDKEMEKLDKQIAKDDLIQPKLEYLNMFQAAKDACLDLDGELCASDRVFEYIKNVYGSKLTENQLSQVEYDLNRVARFETNCRKKCQSVINYLRWMNPELIKTASQAYNAILFDVDSSRMSTYYGRRGNNEPSKLRKVYTREVKFYGDYDKGGWYWGAGKRWFVDFKKDLSYVNFYTK